MNLLNNYLQKTTKAAPLAAFRVFFGLMMLISIIRFWSNGWIEKLYIQPTYFFSYYGFEWIHPLGNYTYLLFIICGLASLAIMLGFQYRLAIITFFLSFTYIELMDKTTYLNHYYFISLLSFLMIFLPANAYFSYDAKLNPKKAFEYIPSWSIDVIKLFLGIVYFYAGLAKLNSDWLIEAMPLKIWLPGKYDLPLLGEFLHHTWLIYVFSWAGALYDLSIPFLLLYNRTRVFAFSLVVVFHVLTRLLFPIGMFPYIMIVSAIIFFDAKVHHYILGKIAVLFKINKTVFDNNQIQPFQNNRSSSFKMIIIGLFFSFHILFPFRYLAYPGELFWTEEGFRFSWRVMLMEKAGYTNFKIVDEDSGKSFFINNADYLTAFQEKQMSTQPDFILQYAHYIEEQFRQKGIKNIGIYVNSYVALNGRKSQPYIDPNVNLLTQKESFNHKNWILPFDEEIKGL
jgi:hypothetical protein